MINHRFSGHFDDMDMIDYTGSNGQVIRDVCLLFSQMPYCLTVFFGHICSWQLVYKSLECIRT